MKNYVKAIKSSYIKTYFILFFNILDQSHRRQNNTSDYSQNIAYVRERTGTEIIIISFYLSTKSCFFCFSTSFMNKNSMHCLFIFRLVKCNVFFLKFSEYFLQKKKIFLQAA